MDEHQVYVMVYDDGLLINVDGKSSFKTMTSQNMLYMARDLIEKAMRLHKDENTLSHKES